LHLRANKLRRRRFPAQVRTSHSWGPAWHPYKNSFLLLAESMALSSDTTSPPGLCCIGHLDRTSRSAGDRSRRTASSSRDPGSLAVGSISSRILRPSSSAPISIAVGLQGWSSRSSVRRKLGSARPPDGGRACCRPTTYGGRNLLSTRVSADPSIVNEVSTRVDVVADNAAHRFVSPRTPWL
jgi:hypothetical protein